MLRRWRINRLRRKVENLERLLREPFWIEGEEKWEVALWCAQDKLKRLEATNAD